MEKTKRCAKCNKTKAHSEFNKNRSLPDGLAHWCRECTSAYSYNYYRRDGKKPRPYVKYEQSHRVVRGVNQKRCGKCKTWKGESDFAKNRSRRDGLSDWCRDCERKRIRKYYRLRGLHLKKYYTYHESHRVVRGVKQKRCRKCRTWKPETQFSRHKYNKDRLEVWCKECISKAQRRSRVRKKRSLARARKK